MPEKTTELRRWTTQAVELGAVTNPLRVPYDIWLQEAAAAAGFLRKRWDPTDELPGMSHAAKRLPFKTADEIQQLVRAVQEAQTNLLLIVDPMATNYGDRARFVIAELSSALAFTLDDDITEEADEQLENIQKFHSQDGQRSSALSQSLRNHAALAESLAKRIVEEDSSFEVALITEAKKLAEIITSGPAQQSEVNTDGEKATLLRNQLMVLLDTRIRNVRKVAAHVFRRHPEIVREVTSAYERRRRTAARRAKGAEQNAAPPAQPA